MHKIKIAERVIQTFKNNFMSILMGVNLNFPMQLWARLVPQAILTLNLMCQSHVAPWMLSHAYLHGPFDYNTMRVECRYMRQKQGIKN